jgi:hypothetical protein
MKETKPFLLIVVSIFLLISVGLLSATIYLYFKRPAENNSAAKAKNSSPATLLNNTRDSLQQIYSAAIRELDTSFTAIPAGNADTSFTPGQSPDSLNNKKGNTAAAFDKLRNEINTILQDKSPDADLELAKMKIGELQSLVGFLKNKNTEITKENERLYALLRQLAGDGKTSGYAAPRNNGAENIPASKSPADAGLRVDNIQLSAIASNDFIEKETTNAEETDKLVGSFTVKNGGGQNTVSEVMVVILQPDGKVLQNSNWETGIFYTKEGKQIYSNKLRFDNNGETKKLNFSLQAEKYLPGKYTVEVYHNGLMIGKTTKTLS